MEIKSMFWEIFKNDFRHQGEPHGRINWGNTNVCIDLRCKCGHHSGHYDGPFFYFWICPKCQTRYAVGRHIKLIALTEEQSKEIGYDKFHLDNPHVDFFVDDGGK